MKGSFIHNDSLQNSCQTDKIVACFTYIKFFHYWLKGFKSVISLFYSYLDIVKGIIFKILHFEMEISHFFSMIYREQISKKVSLISMKIWIRYRVIKIDLLTPHCLSTNGLLMYCTRVSEVQRHCILAARFRINHCK